MKWYNPPPVNIGPDTIVGFTGVPLVSQFNLQMFVKSPHLELNYLIANFIICPGYPQGFLFC
jgi:hypothetical protein